MLTVSVLSSTNSFDCQSSFMITSRLTIVSRLRMSTCRMRVSIFAQLCLSVPTAGSAAGKDERHAVPGELRRFLWAPIGTLEHRGNMGEKNLCVVGFGDKVICAQVHAHQLICFAVAARYDDDRHSGGFSHLPADIIAVKKAAVNIKQDQIRSLLQDGLHNMVKAARRAGFIPIAAQQSGELLPKF